MVFVRFSNGDKFIGTGVYLLLFSSFLNLKALPHFPICIFTRLLMTSLIIAKLLQQRKKLKAVFGEDSELSDGYTFLVHVLAQSSALYSFFSFIFIGLFIGHESAWRMLLPCLPQTGVCFGQTDSDAVLSDFTSY